MAMFYQIKLFKIIFVDFEQSDIAQIFFV